MMRTSNEKDGRNLPADVVLRKPRATDGVRVSDLVASCPPLDENSLYCNLLQCTDFADTCVLAEKEGEAVGWISGYRPPNEPETLFIWQVAVHRHARGLGLARRMLLEVLGRESVGGVSYLKTTITPDNEASRCLFRSLAAGAGAALRETTGFEAKEHFGNRHASERLITIGPLRRRQSAQSAA
jgi:L-2,4-diaminobutyric acid acetyltransferase